MSCHSSRLISATMVSTLVRAIVALWLSPSITGVLATQPGVGSQAETNARGQNKALSQYTREIHYQCQNIQILPLRNTENIPPAPGRPEDRFALEHSEINVTDLQPRPPPPARLIASCGSRSRRRWTELPLDNCLGWDAAGERLIAQQKYGYSHPFAVHRRY